jgi:hypothetical protein
MNAVMTKKYLEVANNNHAIKKKKICFMLHIFSHKLCPATVITPKNHQKLSSKSLRRKEKCILSRKKNISNP